MKLIDIIDISGKITLKSGLHIGAGDMEMRIGGTDNQVIKHPHNQEPYIPGSSLKGKVRSLLEMRSGLMHLTDGEPLDLKTLKNKNLSTEQKTVCEKIIKLFGASGAEEEEIKKAGVGPTRVSFADCPLHEDWRDKVKKELIPLVEVKAENRINRVVGTAQHPRFTERVPSDTEFEFRVTLKKMEEDGEELFNFLLEGLKLLSLDYLGGNGSRGYGRIGITFEKKDLNDKFENIQPFGE
jgi:CRISPR-associated protein Csm3